MLATDLLLKVIILKDLATGWLEGLLATEGQQEVREEAVCRPRPIVARRLGQPAFPLHLLLMLMYLWRLLK